MCVCVCVSCYISVFANILRVHAFEYSNNVLSLSPLSRLSTTITELTTLQVQLDTERESKEETLKQLEHLRSSTDYIINMEEQTTPTNNEST